MDEKGQRRVSSYSAANDQPPFQIDEKVPARYVSFPVLRDLIVRIANAEPVSYSRIVDKPSSAILDVLAKQDGSVMGRSTRYHHLNALRILQLVSPTKKGYTVTPPGEAIARLGSPDEGRQLSAAVLNIFQQVVRSCELVRRDFLVLFTGSVDCDPWRCGAPVGVQPVPGRRACQVTCPKWPGTLVLSAEQTQGIIWGLRYWCQALGLVDEILIRPQAEVAPERANIIFPVDADQAAKMSVDSFEDALYGQLGQANPIYGDTVAISIPLLFYRLCPAERVPLRSARSLLRAWLARHQEHAFVESPSYSVLEAGRLRRGPSREVWRKQEQAFLRIGEKVYSRLLVSKRLWNA